MLLCYSINIVEREGQGAPFYVLENMRIRSIFAGCSVAADLVAHSILPCHWSGINVCLGNVQRAGCRMSFCFVWESFRD
jgi:hypothetical protein